jgi:hypothetical protein
MLEYKTLKSKSTPFKEEEELKTIRFYHGYEPAGVHRQ